PEVHGREAAGVDVKRKNGMTRGACKKDSARLRDAGGTTGTVDREPRRLPARQVAAPLRERARAAARRRAPRGVVSEAADDPGNPLAVEVLAGDHHDAAVLPEEHARQDPSMPEREDRLLPGGDDRFVVGEAFDAPPKARPQPPPHPPPHPPHRAPFPL